MQREEDVPVIVGCGQTKLGKLHKPIPQLVREAFKDALAEADLHSECVKGLVAMPAVADLGKSGPKPFPASEGFPLSLSLSLSFCACV